MDFVSALTIEEAVSHLADRGDVTQVLAGGTDVMLQQMRREITPEVLLHVGRIPGDPSPLIAGATMALVLWALHDAHVLVTLAAGGIAYLAVLWKAGFFASISPDLLPIPMLNRRARQSAN